MELILYVENWSLLLLLTVSTTIGKKMEHFPLNRIVVNWELKRLWKIAFKWLFLFAYMLDYDDCNSNYTQSMEKKKKARPRLLL